jgi:hypothetical protein
LWGQVFLAFFLAEFLSGVPVKELGLRRVFRRRAPEEALVSQ